MNKELTRDFLLYVKCTLNYSDQTVKYYTHVLNVFNDWLEVEITDLTLEDVDRFLLTRNLKHSSKNTEKSILRSYFRYVDRYREIRLRFDYSMIRNARTDDTEIKYFDVKQINFILENVDPHDKLIIYTLFSTGMRIGELVNLTVEDIRYCELHIKGKGGKRRVIPLQPELYEAIMQYIYKNSIRGGIVFRHPITKGRSNVAYSVSGLRKRLQRTCGKLGIEMHPHMFRHSIATSLLRNGMDIRSVQVFLGHEHIQTTMRYTHVSNEHLKDTFLKSYPQNISKILLT